LAGEVSDAELRLLRAAAQGLLDREGARSVRKIAHDALTLQAQDTSAATLALRARSAAAGERGERALTAEGARAQAARPTVCRSWLMRNTIHLFATDDLAWMRPLIAERPLRPALRRLDQLGVSVAKLDEAMAMLAERLERGPLNRAEAIEALGASGIEPGENNSRIYWILHVATLRGILVVRPALERKPEYQAAPADRPLDRDAALGRLARRYLEAYGPAAPQDLASWGKITLTDARLAFDAAGELKAVTTSHGTLSALPDRLEPPRLEGPTVRLLGSWDNYFLGYRDRSVSVPAAHQRRVHPGAGYLKSAVLADGFTFGTWKVERASGALTVVVEPFDRIPRGARSALKREADDLGRFFETEAKLRIEPPAT